MGGNLQQTINWAKTFIQYSPLQAGLGNEPAVSIASMIRNSLLNPPLTWAYNRAETTFITTGVQDYTKQLDDFAFVEKVSLTDDSGNIYEIKDVYNNSALSPSKTPGRPNAMSVESSTVTAGVLSYLFRFMGVPDQPYTVTLVYQKLALPFGPYFISAAGTASGGNTTYTGTFDKLAFPVGSTAIITGFVAHPANNGSFVVVSATATSLVVANAGGVAETIQAYVSNFSWDPIPDSYSDVYNNLFLAEAMALVDDSRSQLYRQRGVAALMAKASGLTEMQKNAFAQQWMARNTERASVSGMTTLGNTGRGI